MKGAVEVLPVLSEAIRQVRFDLGITQEAFGLRVGSVRTVVSRMESGDYRPTTDTLLRIGSWAAPGAAKTAIIEELRTRFADCSIVQVVP